MQENSVGQATGRGRRWTFRIWIAITLALAVFLVGVWPFVQGERVAPVLLGVPVLATMIVLLFLGLGWLIWAVAAGKRRQRNH